MERLWGHAWLEAVVTDYDHSTQLFRLSYELHTKNETHDWFNVLSPSREFRATNRSLHPSDMARVHRGGKGGAPAARPLGGEKRKKGGQHYASLADMDQDHGDFMARVAVPSADELSKLSAQLSHMSDALRTK